jgi:DNA-3-methyladenine glycosylase II
MKKDFQSKLRAAEQHLQEKDGRLATVIAEVGPCRLEPHRDYYMELVESIISQQISTAAARSILTRFWALAEGEFPPPELILSLDDEDLRAVGLSRAKVKYIKDLAAHVVDGRLKIGQLGELSNEEVHRELIDVKGIGEWSVHMFLIFSLGRLNILPVGDLGIRRGMQRLYGLKGLPTPDEMREIADKNGWLGYESVASWYIWRSLGLDLAFDKSK